MNTLDSQKDKTAEVTRELERMGLPIIQETSPNKEVPSKVISRLGPLSFFRAWNYWVVEGPVPLEIALEIEKEPFAKEIRCNGDAGSTKAAESAQPMENGKIISQTFQEDKEKYKKMGERFEKIIEEKFAPAEPGKVYPRFITSYHIDTELGLYIFIQHIKKWLGNENNKKEITPVVVTLDGKNKAAIQIQNEIQIAIGFANYWTAFANTEKNKSRQVFKGLGDEKMSQEELVNDALETANNHLLRAHQLNNELMSVL